MKCRDHGVLLLAAASSMFLAPVHAQEADGGWRFLVAPYAMFPNMKGETGVGNLPDVTVDEDPGDIFENLQFGAMLYAEARNEDWAISSDMLYMKLESEVLPQSQVIDGEAEVAQLGWELAVMRRLSPWFELGLGATWNKIDADVDIVVSALPNAPAISGGLDEDWVDPSVVARAVAPIGEKWRFEARGNVGGFGVGSEMFYQLQVDVFYAMSDRWQFGLGYRYIDVDYEHGGGADRFVYDMSTFGPVLKAGFSF
jgi:hypothetical protein